MEGHVHIGFAHAVSFALTLIIVMAVLRVLDTVLVASDIPLLMSIGKGLAFIIH